LRTPLLLALRLFFGAAEVLAGGFQAVARRFFFRACAVQFRMPTQVGFDLRQP